MMTSPLFTSYWFSLMYLKLYLIEQKTDIAGDRDI